MKRVLSALIAIPPFVLLVALGPPFTFALLVGAAVMVGTWEFHRIARPGRIPAHPWMGYLLAACLSVAFYGGNPLYLAAALTLALLLLFGRWLTAGGSPKESVEAIALTLLGAFFVAWTMGHLIWLRAYPRGQAYIFFLFFVVWVGDTAAFYVGRALGKHPLSAAISPKKTVEGTLAGLGGSTGAALLASFWFLPLGGEVWAILLGLALGALGQLGDLSESLLKRWAGIKDAGTIIPGHGG
ncbi:MAG: phosphatidate cytidylyltransferase, partial [Nitrospinota bacterium]